MQPTGELNQRGRVQRLKEGAVHASEVDRGVLAHRLHSESDRRPRRYPDHPLWVTSPQFGQGEVNGYVGFVFWILTYTNVCFKFSVENAGSSTGANAQGPRSKWIATGLSMFVQGIGATESAWISIRRERPIP